MKEKLTEEEMAKYKKLFKENPKEFFRFFNDKPEEYKRYIDYFIDNSSLPYEDTYGFEESLPERARQYQEWLKKGENIPFKFKYDPTKKKE